MRSTTVIDVLTLGVHLNATAMQRSILLLLAFAASLFGADQGTEIQPDADGHFEYVDDFTTKKFLDDAFLINMDEAQWKPGQIWSAGPARGRMLSYRFFSDRVITSLEAGIEQTANGRNLGSRNTLYLSTNGLDWTGVASSTAIKPNAAHWQNGPVTIPADADVPFLGKSEIWVRIVMDNISGLPTTPSNNVSNFRVALQVGEPAQAGADTQAAMRQAWQQLQDSTVLRAADPPDARAPYYYEDSDGWLVKTGENPLMSPDESQGFLVHRVAADRKRSPGSMALFVKTGDVRKPLMARITVRAHKDASRNMHVLWDGKTLATFDIAHYFDRDQIYYVPMARPETVGVHELRIAGGDDKQILVREVAIAGASAMRFVEKPALPPGGFLEVLSAYYMPDPKPPANSNCLELGSMYKEHEDFGGVQVLLRNNSDVPVRIERSIQLNGKPIEESYVDFVNSAVDARGVVWYRVRPMLVEPRQCGKAYIRFRRRPEGDNCTVTLKLENGDPVEATIPFVDPGLIVDYVTTNKTGERLYIYARRSSGDDPGRVTGITLDGKRLDEPAIYGGDFPAGVALILADLPAKLEPMSYHVVGVESERGPAVAAQFRVLPFWFPRSSIHVPQDACQEMHMNLGMWHRRGLEECQNYDIKTSAFHVFDNHERVAFVLGPDEPDAKDHHGGGTNRTGLGYHARRITQCGRQELIERHSPQAAYWMIMNGTTRPLNWGVYGQVSDVVCYDPYPVTYMGADHSYVRESLAHARRCGTPKRLYAVLEAFGWGGSRQQGVPDNVRGPLPQEYRQNTVQAIGVGMKGLTSWVFAATAGGWDNNDPCREEIMKLNKLIEHIEDDLLVGTPVDIASSDAGLVNAGPVWHGNWQKDRVWVGALLCGPDTIVLAAANHIPAARPGLPTIMPAQNVTITADLPPFLQAVRAFEVTEDGVAPFDCTVEGGKAVLEIGSIESGRVFVLRRE